MSLTKEQVASIPEVYRDFLQALRPIVESEQSVMKITGMPRGRVYSLLQMRGYPYSYDEVASRMEEAGLVSVDDLGFFRPTARGRAVILQMIGEAGPPPLPPTMPPLWEQASDGN